MFMICFFIFKYSSNLHRVFIGVTRPENSVKETRQVQNRKQWGSAFRKSFMRSPKGHGATLKIPQRPPSNWNDCWVLNR
jgi:hypothetical protein